MDNPGVVQTVQSDDIGADPDVRDQLIGLAEKQDDQAYEQWLGSVDHTEVRKAAEEAVTIVLGRLYKLCQPLIETGPKAQSNLTQIVQKLIIAAPADKAEMRKQAIEFIKTARWLRVNSLGLALPKTISRLWRLASRHFTKDTTYADVSLDRIETENILLVEIPEVTYQEGLSAQIEEASGKPVYTGRESAGLQTYVDSVAALLHLIPDNEELWGAYMIRSSSQVYYLQLVCDMLLSAQTADGSSDDDAIDLELAFKLAPALLLPLAIARDDLLKDLTLPEERQAANESLTQASPPVPPTQVPNNAPPAPTVQPAAAAVLDVV